MLFWLPSKAHEQGFSFSDIGLPAAPQPRNIYKLRNISMYNLMVTASDNAWEEGSYTWHKSRILEYTAQEHKERFKDLSPSALEFLSSLPTLFMYEHGAEGTPRIGKITKIQKRGAEFRVFIEINQNLPPLSLDQIEALKWDLEIQDFEFSPHPLGREGRRS